MTHVRIPPHLQKFLHHARVAGVVGPVVAAAMCARFGWTRGEDWIGAAGQATGFALASLGVGFGLIIVSLAWRLKLRHVAHVALGLWAIMVVAEFAAHFGYLSSNSAASRNVATMSAASYQQAQNAVTEAEADVARLRSETARIPARSQAEAEAAVNTAKVHKWFALTNGCTAQAPGPQTRKFCADFHAASGDVANWTARAGKLADLEKAQERLDGLRKGAGATKLVHSSADAQADGIAKLMLMTLSPSKSEQEAAVLVVTLVLTAVFVGFGVWNWLFFELLPFVGDANHGSSDATGPASVAPSVSRVSTAVPIAPGFRNGDAHAVKTLSGLMARAANAQQHAAAAA